MAQTPKAPPTFADGLNAAMQDIAGAMGAPDADVKFSMALLAAIGTHLQKRNGQGAGPQAPPATPGTGGPPPPGAGGGPDMPPGGAGAPGGPAGPPPGVSGPAGPAGGSPANSAMMNQAGPQAPTMGGLSKGLTPNPDELRRVLADVAGQ